MATAKICAIGKLDLNINLILHETIADLLLFDINNINNVKDLKNLFFPIQNQLKIDLFEFVSISSNSELINTLLFINRAFKNKSFVELILLNQLDFSEETQFIKNLIKQSCSKQYLYIVENKIYDIPSKITFNIKILKDKNDKLINQKSFNLFEKNILLNENDNDKFLLLYDKLHYNFSKVDYFFVNLDEFLEFKNNNNYDEITNFYSNLIENFPNLKIIINIKENFLNNSDIKFINCIKNIFNLTDVFFSDRKTLNEFYKNYQSKFGNFSTNNKNNSKNNKFINEIEDDLILLDYDKKRKDIERKIILFEDLDLIQVYIQQGTNLNIYQKSEYFVRYGSKENREYYYQNKTFFNSIYIGAFLSRLINDKLFKTCHSAGNLTIQNTIELLKNNIEYITDADFYNVVVHYKKKQKERNFIDLENHKIQSKENGFVLDCTNPFKAGTKEYNALTDINCGRFLGLKETKSHLKKVGFINKKGYLLPDPDKIIYNYNFEKVNIKDFIDNTYIKNPQNKKKEEELSQNQDKMRKTFYSVNNNINNKVFNINSSNIINNNNNGFGKTYYSVNSQGDRLNNNDLNRNNKWLMSPSTGIGFGNTLYSQMSDMSYNSVKNELIEKENNNFKHIFSSKGKKQDLSLPRMSAKNNNNMNKKNFSPSQYNTDNINNLYNFNYNINEKNNSSNPERFKKKKKDKKNKYKYLKSYLDQDLFLKVLNNFDEKVKNNKV